MRHCWRRHLGAAQQQQQQRLMRQACRWSRQHGGLCLQAAAAGNNSAGAKVDSDIVHSLSIRCCGCYVALGRPAAKKTSPGVLQQRHTHNTSRVSAVLQQLSLLLHMRCQAGKLLWLLWLQSTPATRLTCP